jgi:hypothetical protein
MKQIKLSILFVLLTISLCVFGGVSVTPSSPTTISGSVTVTDGSGPMTVDGTVAVTGALTDSELRATPVPVSGTVTVNAGTNLNTSSLSTSANQTTIGSQTTKINDGTDTALVSGSGSLQVTCDNCGGASPFEDEDAFTVGTSSVGMTGYYVDDVAPDSAPENSGAAPRMSVNRIPYSILRDAAGNERGANVTASNALVVDGSAVTQPVSATNLDVQIGGSDSLTIGTFPDNEPINVAQINGVTPLMGSGNTGTGSPRVTLATDQVALTTAGVFSVKIDQTTPGTTNEVAVTGNAGGAFDAANNGTAPANVVVAGVQLRDTTTATAGTVGQVGSPVASLDHVLYVRNAGPVIWSCGLAGVAASLTQCQAAPGASLSLYITDILTTSSTTTSGLFTLRYGTGANCGTGTGNIFAASATATLANGANTLGQAVKTFQTPIKIPANNAICVLGVATNTTNITINGFTAP